MDITAAQSEPGATAQGPAEPSAVPGKPADRPANLRHIQMAQAFSQIMAVLMRDPKCKNLRLADLEWLVLPPILAGQYKLGCARAQDDKTKETGIAIPAATALWARVSAAVDKRLSQNLDGKIQLQPHEWASGNHLWLIAAAGDPRIVGALLKDLGATEFKGRPVKLRTRGADGKAAIQVLSDYAS